MKGKQDLTDQIASTTSSAVTQTSAKRQRALSDYNDEDNYVSSIPDANITKKGQRLAKSYDCELGDQVEERNSFFDMLDIEVPIEELPVIDTLAADNEEDGDDDVTIEPYDFIRDTIPAPIPLMTNKFSVTPATTNQLKTASESLDKSSSASAALLRNDLTRMVFNTAATNANVNSASSSTSIANPEIEYAPKLRPVSGNRKWCIIVLGWHDKRREQLPSLGDAASMGRSSIAVYKNNSRGQLTLETSVKFVPVPFNQAKKNENKAAQYAIKRVGKNAFDKFAIIDNNNLGFSHAGANIIYLQGASLDRNFWHEAGHSEGLGHAGRAGDSYGDPRSFMGKFPTPRLTSAQLYNQGWLYEKEVAQYDNRTGSNSTTMKYPIEFLYPLTKDPSTNLKAIRILRPEGREVFVTLDKDNKKPLLLGHYRSGGTSQQFAQTNKQFSVDNLLIKNEGNVDGTYIISVGPNPNLKP